MYKDYLKELVRHLEAVQVYDAKGTPFSDYEAAMQTLMELFFEIKRTGKQVFFIGNGGSAGIASHLAADFMKNGGMRTYSLYDNSLTTCMGNDYGYEYIFSKPLGFLGNEGDLLVAISSSGNSQNIVNAVDTAHKKGMRIFTLSGFKEDNRIKSMGTYNLHVPVCHYGMVESIHILILQQIVDTILERDGECL